MHSKASATFVKKKLFVVFSIFATYNTLVIFYIMTNLNTFSKNLASSTFGDYLRKDLLAVLVQGNFTSPWEYHPEAPDIIIQPYFPLPFLVMKLFGVKIINWGPNLFFVQFITIGSIFLINYFVWVMLRKFEFKFRIITILAFGIFSIPISYIYTTGNVQGILTSLIFLCFVSNKNRILEFISIVSVASFKPQYLIINLMKFISTLKDFRFFLHSCFIGLLLSLYGFYYFGNQFVSNIKFAYKSLQAFTNPPVELLVRLNTSIIGNLSAVESYFYPDKMQDLLVLKLQNIIIFMFLLVSLILIYMIRKFDNLHWIALWIAIGIPVYLTPISYNYSLALFLIPLVLFLKQIIIGDKIALNVISNNQNFTLFVLSLFFIFSPKPFHILLGTTSFTNLFNMVNSLGCATVIILALNIMRLNKVT
jgi:hypothetical protein